MTTYYVNPALTTGTNNGDPDNASGTYANAWQSLQECIDAAGSNVIAAGDTIECLANGSSADETLALGEDITLDQTNEGQDNTGWIKFIGVSAFGTNDGTRYIIDGNDAAYSCIKTSVLRDMLWWENFDFRQATNRCVDRGTNGGQSWVFLNCAAHDGEDDGFYDGGSYGLYIRCSAYSNLGEGFYIGSSTITFACSSYDNSQDGFNPSLGSMSLSCLAYDNSLVGFSNFNRACRLFFNVSDNNGGGVTATSSLEQIGIMIGNRITNNTTAIDLNSTAMVEGWNYFANSSGSPVITDALLMENISNNGVATTTRDGSDTDEGYAGKATDNYELDPEATLFSTPVEIPPS